VQLVLRERIEQGFYGPNGFLPAEMELAREFEVSRITVSRAINELAQLGFVDRRRGAGTRIVSRDVTPPIPAEDIDGPLENLADLEKLADTGTRSRARVLEFGPVLPPVDCQRELQVGPNELVQRAVRVRSYNDVPYSYLTSFMPGHIGQRFSREDMNAASLMTLFDRSGIKVVGARQSFSASLADPKIARALGIPVGTPLLAVTRTVLGSEEKPVKFIRILYRTDRYQYRITMERDPQASSGFRPARSVRRKKTA
jgi:GntR family transcriptional regulator